MANLFSVVMSVYYRTAITELNDAVNSVFNQSRPPTELVIVCDGSVSNELEDYFKTLTLNYSNVVLLRIKHNIGPGGSRDYGIRRARNDFVAIMDSDDISIFTRFEKQLQIFDSMNVDVVGGYILEFDSATNKEMSLRVVPIENDDIYIYGKTRQPFNNVTLMIRKSSYIKCGGYPALRYNEDYMFFVRGICAGLVFFNINEVLVSVRSSNDYYTRRSGLKNFKEDLILFGEMKNLGYMNALRRSIWILQRLIFRFAPASSYKYIYKYLLRSK